MKLILFFLIFTLSFSSSVKAKEILVNASAIIIEGKIFHAQEQALRNAQFVAVKKGVESIMDNKTININFGVIRNNIYKFSNNFIVNYKVIKEERILEESLYKISILANVNDEKIKKKLKLLRILKDKKQRKRILLVYFNNLKESLTRDSEIVTETLRSVNESLKKYSFSTFDRQKINEVYLSIEENKINRSSLNSLILLSLAYNADILVIMQLNARQSERFNKPLYKVYANILFSVYDTLTGRQITETNVNAFETSAIQLNNSDSANLMKKASIHASIEAVRQTVNHIKSYYQKLGFLLNEYNVIFSNYLSEHEKIIIDYFENDLVFRDLSELKNTFGHLELELFTKKRKGVLRRKIISDLLKKEIEVASKSLSGNRLLFINPNSTEKITNTDNISINQINNK